MIVQCSLVGMSVVVGCLTWIYIVPVSFNRKITESKLQESRLLLSEHTCTILVDNSTILQFWIMGVDNFAVLHNSVSTFLHYCFSIFWLFGIMLFDLSSELIRQNCTIFDSFAVCLHFYQFGLPSFETTTPSRRLQQGCLALAIFCWTWFLPNISKPICNSNKS